MEIGRPSSMVDDPSPFCSGTLYTDGLGTFGTSKSRNGDEESIAPKVTNIEDSDEDEAEKECKAPLQKRMNNRAEVENSTPAIGAGTGADATGIEDDTVENITPAIGAGTTGADATEIEDDIVEIRSTPAIGGAGAGADATEIIVWDPVGDPLSIIYRVAKVFMIDDEESTKKRKKMFFGKVVKIAEESEPGAEDTLFRIEWEDGDADDFDEREYFVARKLYRENAAQGCQSFKSDNQATKTIMLDRLNVVREIQAARRNKNVERPLSPGSLPLPLDHRLRYGHPIEFIQFLKPNGMKF